jgi:RNAse (barnase) inhibitor barstar
MEKVEKTAGGSWWHVSSWGWTTRGPTLGENSQDGAGFIPYADLSTLPASQLLFIKLMRCVERVEDQRTIEALKLPLKYTGQTLPISEVITTETEWSETLDALLDAIEQETGRPFADTYVTGLFSYNFLERCASNVYTPMKTHEDHNGP